MPVTYTNRKGYTYHLCRGVTKTGKPRYYFARAACAAAGEAVINAGSARGAATLN